METSVVVFRSTEAVIADLAARYKNAVFDVTKADGMAEAKAAYKDINAHSITLENARVAEKAASLAYGKFVDSEARRISEKLDALRLPIKSQIEAETKRAEREREEKVRLEMERIAAEEKARKEAEEKKLVAERAEIAAAREKLEAEQRASRERIEAEERAARLAREDADRAARQAREAEEAKLKAERDRIDTERREIEERQRKEREAEEAKLREAQRLANELNDGYEMLATFVRRFGARDEFRPVVKAIGPYLRKGARASA